MASGEKNKNLLLLYRNIEHEYQLTGYTDEALKSIQKSLNIARDDLFNEIGNRDFRIPKGREDMMLERLNDMTLGIQGQLTQNIQEAAVVAGEYSYKEYNNILSFDGKLADTVGFNFVSVSPEQLRAMAVNTPVGGKLLQDWVSDSFSLRITGEIQTAIMADNFRGLSTNVIIDRMTDAFGMIKRDAESLTRTYIADINNTAAEAVYKANSDIIKYETWNAALEVSVSGSGTCLRCAACDGRRYKIEEPHIRPPLHISCRCFMLPETLSYRELGLDIDELKTTIRPYTERADKRKIIAAGQFDGDFQSFLNSRGAKYQKDLLGPNRYRLIEEGKIKFDDLVDKDGNVVLLKKGKGGDYSGLVASQKYKEPKKTVIQKKPPKAEIIRTKSIPDAQKAMAGFEVSDAQRKALKDYTGEQYTGINGFLRGTKSKLYGNAGETMENLDGFLKDAPKIETESFRGIGINESLFNDWKGLKKGSTFVDKGFVSTTRDKGVVGSFLGNEQYQVEMHIKGKNGVLIESLSDAKAEKEILFPKGTVFIVEKIKTKKSKFTGKMVLNLVEMEPEK